VRCTGLAARLLNNIKCAELACSVTSPFCHANVQGEIFFSDEFTLWVHCWWLTFCDSVGDQTFAVANQVYLTERISV